MKNLTATFLIASIATLRVSHADEAVQPQESQTIVTQEEKALEQTPQAPIAAQEAEAPELSTEAPISTEPQTDEKPAYTHVGKASHDSVAAAKSKQWQNILIAAGAVAIAITALILVHNNAGH
jgi:hypothetical protein